MLETPSLSDKTANASESTLLIAAGEHERLAIQGGALLAQHLLDLAAAAALGALCSALGLRVLDRMRLPMWPLERLTCGFALGGGLIGTTMLVVGMSLGLEWPVITGTLLGFVILAGPAWKDIPGLLAESLAQVRKLAPGRVERTVAMFALLLIPAILALVALAPPFDWDSLTYHVRVPLQFLERGRVFLPEDNLHVAFIGIAHGLYLPLLAFDRWSGPALMSVLTSIMLALAIVSACARFLPGPSGVLSALALWGTPTTLLVASTPRVEVTLTLYLFLSSYAVALATREPALRSSAYLCALLLGFAIGIKYNGLLYAAGLIPAVFLAWRAHRPRQRQFSLPVFGLLLVAAAIVPYVKNVALIGAPLYPFFAESRLEPWVRPAFGSTIVPDSVDAQFLTLASQVRSPFNLADAFFAPGSLTVEFEGAMQYLNPILLFAPLGLIAVRREIPWLVLPALTYLVALLGPFPATNLRYLVPALPGFSVLAIVGLLHAGRRLVDGRGRSGFLSAIGVTAGLPVLPVLVLWTTETPMIGHAVGLVSGGEYLTNHFDPGVRGYADLLHAAERLPSSSRTLMLYESRGLYLDTPVVEDTRLTNWPLLSASRWPGRCLKGSGFTHVLINGGAVQYYRSRGAAAEMFLPAEWERFAARCLVPEYRSAGVSLFRLRPPS